MPSDFAAHPAHPDHLPQGLRPNAWEHSQELLTSAEIMAKVDEDLRYTVLVLPDSRPNDAASIESLMGSADALERAAEFIRTYSVCTRATVREAAEARLDRANAQLGALLDGLREEALADPETGMRHVGNILREARMRFGTRRALAG